MQLPTQLLQRSRSAHKGDFGHVLVIAGSWRYSGAAALCAYGAIRSGAGLVTLGVPESLALSIVKIKPKEVMVLPLPETKEGAISLGAHNRIKQFLLETDVLVIGPGLGQNKSTQSLVRRIVKSVDLPVVIDADGLNSLVGHLSVLQSTINNQQSTILTPHPGEMARLLGMSVKQVQANRKKVAKNFAKDYNCTVILKGHHTVVADRKSIYINKTGNPGMASGGTGDVLTGMVGAFLAQGLQPFEAAKYAVYLHGLAGDLAAREKTQLGMIASDIVEKIPEAITKCS